MVALNFTAPIPMHEAIEAYALQFRVPKAEAVRQLVAAGLTFTQTWPQGTT